VATQQGAAWTVADTRVTSFSISTFGEDEAGEIYVADHDGVVYRIVADHPAPAVSSIQPDSAPVGSGAFTLMVRGSNFVPGAQVLWNGAARSTTFVDNGVLQAEIPASDIATQGAAQVTVNNPAPGGGASASLQFVVEAGVPMMPTINEGGVVNAASFAAGNGVSPGSIVSVFGVDLAVDERPAGELPLPKTLNGTTLRFNGVLAAPQFYQHPLQMNIQAPWELEGQAEATLQAEVAGQTSAEVAVALATYNPGLFSVPPGADQGAILISGTPLLAAAENAVAEAPSRPARRGEYLEIFGTGLGPVNADRDDRRRPSASSFRRAGARFRGPVSGQRRSAGGRAKRRRCCRGGEHWRSGCQHGDNRRRMTGVGLG
jgi:uncharacterized protein (TIGR03437 family)